MQRQPRGCSAIEGEHGGPWVCGAELADPACSEGNGATTSTRRAQSQPSPVREPHGTPGKDSLKGRGLQGLKLNKGKVGGNASGLDEALGASGLPTQLAWLGSAQHAPSRTRRCTHNPQCP